MVIQGLNTMLKEALEAKGITNPEEYHPTYSVSFFSGNEVVDFTFIFESNIVTVKTIIYIYSVKASRDKSEFKIPYSDKEWEEIIELSLRRAIEKIPEHQKNLLKE